MVNTNSIKKFNNNHREPIYVECYKYKTEGGIKAITDYGSLLYSIDDG